MHCRFVLGLVIVLADLGCSKSRSDERTPPIKTEAASKPANGAADRLVDSMTEYVVTIATVPFTGDCEAWSNAALKAEPIMLSIQTQMQAIASSPDHDAIKADVKTRGPAQAEAALKAKGMTMADYEAQEAKIHSTCKGNPAFEAAMPHIAMKKKSPPASP
jgi:hypothetical protein